MSSRNKFFLIFESLLRVPPLLLMDEILRYSFGLGFGTKSEYVLPIITTSRAVVAETPIQNKSIFDFLSDENSHMAKYISWYKTALPLWSQFLPDLWQFHSVDPNTQSVAGKSSDSEYLFHVGLGNTNWARIHPIVSEDLLKMADVFGCLILFSALLIMFVLSSKNLIKIYSYLLGCLSLYISYIINPIPTTWSTNLAPAIMYNILIRVILALVYLLTFSYSNCDRDQDNRHPISKVMDYLVFSLFFVTGLVRFHAVMYILLVVFLENIVRINPTKVYQFLKLSWDETKRVRQEFGISHLIQVESGRLRLNTVFRMFWISRAAFDVFYRCCDQSVGQTLKYVLIRGTETLTGIIGITTVISCIAKQFGDFVLWILYNGTNSESDANRFGSISTVLFFILSLQTGLTSLDPEKRFDRLIKNMILLATALFHALHQMLSPVLHAFRTFQALQIRAVVLSVAFLTISAYSTVILVQSSYISTWSLAVFALAIEFKVKMVISLVISLVVYLSQVMQYPDAFQKLGRFVRFISPQFLLRFLSHLYDEISHEDLVFYLKSFANIAEFFTGIFLFTNAIWIFLFESASAIRAIGLSIHAYFNIWCEAKKGWNIYCQRRTAAVKIMSLRDATEQQLMDKRDDVCAICYEEMENAKVTYCAHLFHAACLRKWLYLQNTCPLCHELLYSEETLGLGIPDAQPDLPNAGAGIPDAPAQPNNTGDTRLIEGVRYYRTRQSSENNNHTNTSEVEAEEDENRSLESHESDFELGYGDSSEEDNNGYQQRANGDLMVFL